MKHNVMALIVALALLLAADSVAMAEQTPDTSAVQKVREAAQ